MKLTYVIPVTIYVYAWERNQFALEGSFEHDGLRVDYRFLGDAPTKNLNLAIPFSFMMACAGLQVDVDDMDSGILRKLVDAQSWDALVAVLAKLANRILRSIRNIGLSAHVAEIKLGVFASESYLSQWGAGVVAVNGTSQPLITPPSLVSRILESLFSAMEFKIGELVALRWPAIQDAVRENRQPGPGQEFVVNAIEHIRRGNLRYALLESVIALEIAMTSFIRLFLERRDVPKKLIDGFLSPQLTLQDRISILLNLTLGPGELQGVEIDRVVKAITWRNDIVHKYGTIRQGIPERVQEEGIWAVIHLAGLLKTKYEELRADPELQPIVKEMREGLGGGISAPVILLRSPEPHHIVADIVYIVEKAMPDRAGLQTIVDRLADKLFARDALFDKNRRFFVSFVVLPNDVRARWGNGELTMLGGAPS